VIAAIQAEDGLRVALTAVDAFVALTAIGGGVALRLTDPNLPNYDSTTGSVESARNQYGTVRSRPGARG
jgi:hypothetical protein